MFKLPKITLKSLVGWYERKHGLLAVELAGCAAVLVALAHYSWPGALALGGIGAVFAAERQGK